MFAQKKRENLSEEKVDLVSKMPLAKRRCVSPMKHPYILRNLDTFRNTFQKPSCIYKFLNEIWKSRPLFLNRELSYISKHRNRTLRKRDHKIDIIAEKLRNNADQHALVGTTKQSPDRSRSISSSNICYFNWICIDNARTSLNTRSYGFVCPWCERDYNFLDSLMAHLRCCHSRFDFNLVEEDGQPVIEMTLNMSYDGSYCGFKYPGHNLRCDFRFTSDYPQKRPVSEAQILFFRARTKKNVQSIDVPDLDVSSGRLFYHTSTCLPIKPNEVDLDSEADMDPEWLRERTQLMIDEFTDVNEGEKEILKMWNLHIMKNYRYKCDSMMSKACMDFVESEGSAIISKNLSRNFTLHLANLFDFGLIGSQDMLDCIRKLNKLKSRVVGNLGKKKMPSPLFTVILQ